MSTSLALTDGDIAEFCRQILEMCKPEHVLYVGISAVEVTEEFRRQGAAASGLPADLEVAGKPGDLSILPGPDGQSFDWPDVLILEQHAIQKAASLPAEAFFGQFGKPEIILVVLFPAGGELHLPFAAQWLNRSGYVHDFSIDLWVAEKILTCAFTRHLPENGLVYMYEAEWWRLAVLNRKRRRMLQDYMEELIQSGFYYNQKVLEVMDLENRWKAFWSSRTGRAVQWIEELRRRLRFSR